MNQAEPIRVVLVDDHSMVRSGLSAFMMVFDDLEFVGEAGSGEEAVDLCVKTESDVLIHR
jgi:NarL family two-component system response regulator LiaR